MRGSSRSVALCIWAQHIFAPQELWTIAYGTADRRLIQDRVEFEDLFCPSSKRSLCGRFPRFSATQMFFVELLLLPQRQGIYRRESSIKWGLWIQIVTEVGGGNEIERLMQSGGRCVRATSRADLKFQI